jgi:protein-S-isoprenylcysteine O-methyltransferase Ste14
MEMKDLLLRLNDLPVFDPSRWPRRELLGRLCGLAACGAFILHRILRFTEYTGDIPPFLKALTGETFAPGASLIGLADWHWIMWFAVWVVETGIFMGYILAFITRTDARSVARGFMEVVFPVAVASLPVLITLTPMNFRSVWPRLLGSGPGNGSWEPIFFVFLGIIMAGGAVNLVGLLTLRKAFTIMSEARMLIRHGIFSLVRHPLYSGHFVMFFGYLMFHLSWLTCLLYAAFLAGQYMRVRIEEAKLEKVFPDYLAYRQTTGMFFPKIVHR